MVLLKARGAVSSKNLLEVKLEAGAASKPGAQIYIPNMNRFTLTVTDE